MSNEERIAHLKLRTGKEQFSISTKDQECIAWALAEIERMRAALSFIDSICGDDFCEDLEMRMAAAEVTLTEREFEAAKKLSVIYRAAHSHAPGSCYAAHGDWRKEVSDAIAAQATDGGEDA